MFSTILVPLDGSALAERVLPFAVRLARAAKAKLALVRAGVPSKGYFPSPGDTGSALARQAESELLAVAETLRKDGVAVETLIYYDDEDVARAVVQAAGEAGADLIVMSTHGRSGVGRWVYGSVADAVMRYATVPVLLVPAACDREWPVHRGLRVLVPLDGSDVSGEAIPPAVELARVLEAEILLLQVVEPPSYAYASEYPYLTFDVDAELAEARKYLEMVAAELRAGGLVVSVHVASGSPASMIASVARDRGADIIAMATHGRGGLARLVMGSVATGTVQRSSVPVLVVRPSAMRQASAQPGGARRARVRRVEARVPSAGTSGPAVTITLSLQELDLVERGLGELALRSEGDWRLAEPARDLLARLKEAELAARS